MYIHMSMWLSTCTVIQVRKTTKHHGLKARSNRLLQQNFLPEFKLTRWKLSRNTYAFSGMNGIVAESSAGKISRARFPVFEMCSAIEAQISMWKGLEAAAVHVCLDHKSRCSSSEKYQTFRKSCVSLRRRHHSLGCKWNETPQVISSGGCLELGR